MWKTSFARLCAALLLAGSILSAQTASAFTSVANTATVTLAGVEVDPDLLNNTSTAELTALLDVILVATKADVAATYTPGSTTSYTVTVLNSGVTQAEDVDISDTLPTGATLTGISCSTLLLATCGSTTAVAGDASFTHTGNVIPTGGSIVLTVDVAFASSMTAATITNTANVIDNTSGVTTSASDINARAVVADVAIAKSATGTTYTPGGTDTYTLTITNAGPSDAIGATVADILPAGVTLSGAWSCTPEGSGSACAAASGGTAGDSSISATIDVIDGGTVTITIPVVFASTEAGFL